ncbi:unnamed protein product [Kluyveromyces dobzhanskii CBS 2104]|uniref:WGS project CCBQ000000000 data, contig 00015 n=1 Tax=Kluyveromyces dobzhanskii CBS 2104 TaxID=1427455 RepID=A0A0A8L9K0_9SACH|nr:unnamed protein product [Kluyveromyces dobzhanskii CBS 2104]
MEGENNVKVEFDLLESEKVLLKHKWAKLLEEVSTEISISMDVMDFDVTKIIERSLHSYELQRVTEMGVGYDELLLRKQKNRQSTSMRKDRKKRDCIY